MIFLQVAVPELLDAVKGADILIFVIPHQFVSRVCDTIKGHIKTDAVGMSLIKVSFLICISYSMKFSLSCYMHCYITVCVS